MLILESKNLKINVHVFFSIENENENFDEIRKLRIMILVILLKFQNIINVDLKLTYIIIFYIHAMTISIHLDKFFTIALYTTKARTYSHRFMVSWY